MSVNYGMSAGKNVLAAALTLGMASGYHVAVDPEKVRNVLEEAKVLSYLVPKKEALDHERATIQEQQAQRLRDQINSRRALVQARRDAERRDRLPQLPEVRKLGARICKDQATRYGIVRYIGYLERVAEGKVQIRVAFARYMATPTLAPGGFEPHVIWDDPLNGFLCE